MAKGEISHNEQFPLLSHCIQKCQNASVNVKGLQENIGINIVSGQGIICLILLTFANVSQQAFVCLSKSFL